MFSRNKMRRRVLSLLAPAMLIAPGVEAQDESLPAGTYRLDQHHASLRVSVNHLGFSDYVMSFDRFDAVLELDPADPASATLAATVEPTSLDVPTPPEGFVADLLGETWLNAEAHPEITFVTDTVVLTGERTADIRGELSLRGVVRPVTLRATFNGGYRGHPMDPNARIGFSAETVFDRSDFGMTFGIPAPGSTMGVGDEVTVEIDAEFTGPALEDTGE